MNVTKTINQKLLHIIKNEFEGCEWFIISSNELMKTLNDTTELFQDSSKSFEDIKNYIGEIGISIGNVEKCLEGVEECYGRLVEALSNEAQKNK